MYNEVYGIVRRKSEDSWNVSFELIKLTVTLCNKTLRFLVSNPLFAVSISCYLVLRASVGNRYMEYESVDRWRRIHEPTLTVHLSAQQLRSFSDEKLRTGFPCHSQSVERFVKETTKASSKVIGEGRKIANVLLAIKGRN